MCGGSQAGSYSRLLDVFVSLSSRLGGNKEEHDLSLGDEISAKVDSPSANVEENGNPNPQKGELTWVSLVHRRELCADLCPVRISETLTLEPSSIM